MRFVLSAMPAYMRQSLLVMFQYRGEIMLWAIWGIVYPAVAMAMWAAAIKGSPDGQTIRGFATGDFVAYFWLTMIVGHLATTWDVYEMGYLVQSGAMSPRLLRPVLPVWQSLADNLAFKILTLVLLIPIWTAIVLFTHPHFEATNKELLLGSVAVLLAAIVNFLWSYVLALLAFHITRTEAVGQFWFGAGLFFGGRLAPLTIMPEPIQKIASALPFKWVIWFPCEALMGRLSERAVYSGLLNQVAWIGLGIFNFWWLWRWGVKRYTAVGN